MFSEQEAQRFPGPRLWDHAIELKKDAPATLPGKIYALTQDEQKALQEFIKEHVQKGYIRPSKSPYAAPFFFIKKKDGQLRPVQDYRRLNEWTIRNRYPLPLVCVKGNPWVYFLYPYPYPSKPLPPLRGKGFDW